MRKLPLYTIIFIGMFAGIVIGLLTLAFAWDSFVINWIKPFGTIFINLLKLIAIPLIMASLISGVSNLKDIAKLSRIGGKTLGLYIITTVLAISIGLTAVNIIKPGNYLPPEMQQELAEKYAQEANLKMSDAESLKSSGPLQPLVDIVPENIFGAASANRNMLQVIFFSLLFGVALIMTQSEKGMAVKNFFDGANDVILKIVDMIMRFAPFGVAALISSLIVEIKSWDLFIALGVYALTVLLCLGAVIFIVYPVAIHLFTPIRFINFLKAMAPAQLMAFSTSSSAATLPVTMDCVEKNLHVKDEISSFTLPLGATVNMDGTSIHQAISAVFIAQVFGHDLTLLDQLTIILTATLSSIGAAAVPSAGLVTLVIVLGSIGVAPEGLALIIAIDRPLDMCRTVVNITGDAVVTSIVATTENGFLIPPKDSKE
jgi:Na+/H+-dicarboxylate symporter